MATLDPNLIREKALQQQVTSEQFDKLITVTSIPAWIALVLIAVILLFVLGWGIFGTIPEYVRGQGILLAQSGSVFSAQGPEAGGYLASILVQPGDLVKKNETIAYLKNNDLAGKVAVQQQYVDKLTKDFQDLTVASQQELATHKTSTAKVNENLQESLIAEQSKLTHIQETLKVVQEYYKKGLVTRFQLLEITRSFYDTQSSIQQKKQAVTNNEVELNKFIDEWNDRLRNIDLKLKQENYNLDNLKSQLALAGAVLSPVAGVVIDIDTNIGSKVDATTAIATIASIGGGMDAVIFVPAVDGKRIKANMRTLISPANVKREEYGSMVGQVLSVSEYPTNAKSMLALLQNQELVDKFTKEGAPVAVRVQLQHDATSKSGLQWTSSKGPNMIITPGTIVTSLITVREEPPLALVIPTVKKIVLGY